MRKIIFGLAPFLLAASQSAVAALPWKVSEVSGDVRLLANGRARPATKGALLGGGSTIATGHRARAVIVRGQEFVIISPRTQLRVPAERSSNRIMQIIEDFGTAVFKIEKKSESHFGVQTPYLAAVVKGTTFTVTVGPEGSTVQVTEGAVQVSTLDGGAAELVRPGNIAMVGANDLFRLSLEGENSKVVRSPNGPPEERSKGPSARSSAYSGPPGQEMRVSRNVGEESKSLSKTTDGLLEGRASDMALAEFREQEKAARKEGSNPGYGEGNGGEGGNPGAPGKPDDAGKPGTSPEPGKPDKPQDPVTPGTPADPAKPDKPQDPVTPGTPPAPSKPDKPQDPVTPGTPPEPAKPIDPGKPEGPIDPGKPGGAEDVVRPEQPGSKPDSGPDMPGGPADKGGGAGGPR